MKILDDLWFWAVCQHAKNQIGKYPFAELQVAFLESRAKPIYHCSGRIAATKAILEFNKKLEELANESHC